MAADFEWDERKNLQNQAKHGVSFNVAQYAFRDQNRVIIHDTAHSTATEQRYYCIGLLDDSIMTVRFVYRDKKIRIIGAGHWRKGRKLYETQEN